MWDMWKRRKYSAPFWMWGVHWDKKNISIEDTPMKTLRRNNIKAIAEVLNKITEKNEKNNGRKE